MVHMLIYFITHKNFIGYFFFKKRTFFNQKINFSINVIMQKLILILINKDKIIYFILIYNLNINLFKYTQKTFIKIEVFFLKNNLWLYIKIFSEVKILTQKKYINILKFF